MTAIYSLGEYMEGERHAAEMHDFGVNPADVSVHCSLSDLGNDFGAFGGVVNSTDLGDGRGRFTATRALNTAMRCRRIKILFGQHSTDGDNNNAGSAVYSVCKRRSHSADTWSDYASNIIPKCHIRVCGSSKYGDPEHSLHRGTVRGEPAVHRGSVQLPGGRAVLPDAWVWLSIMLRYGRADSSPQHFSEYIAEFQARSLSRAYAALGLPQHEPVKPKWFSERDPDRESVKCSGMCEVRAVQGRRIHKWVVLPGNKWDLLQLLHGPNIEPEF